MAKGNLQVCEVPMAVAGQQRGGIFKLSEEKCGMEWAEDHDEWCGGENKITN
jgi:hypothetical protein